MSTPDSNNSEMQDDATNPESQDASAADASGHSVDDHFIDAAGNADVALSDQLAAAIEERDANHERWLRAQAELENYRRRSNKEISEVRQYQSLAVIRDLLPATDNLHRALDAAEQSPSFEEFVTGVKMIAKQIEDVFSSHNAIPIDAVNKPFDPNLHEALQHMPSPQHPAMTVMQEVEKGYMLHERVIRPTKVLVSSGPPSED